MLHLVGRDRGDIDMCKELHREAKCCVASKTPLPQLAELVAEFQESADADCDQSCGLAIAPKTVQVRPDLHHGHVTRSQTMPGLPTVLPLRLSI